MKGRGSRSSAVAGARGATLVDLLTSMTLILLLTGSAHTWARGALFAHKVLEASAAAQQEAVLAVDVLAREIRNAGFDAGSALSPIPAASRESLELVADLNGDGDLDDAAERVRYAYRADRRQVTRASGHGSPQPFADDVPAGGLHFTFRDEGGGELNAGSADLNEADVARIRRVDVRLRIELSNPDPRAAAPIAAQASMTVALRNR
jgi:hypothetical protein